MRCNPASRLLPRPLYVKMTTTPKTPNLANPGVTSSDFSDIYVDRPNDETSCATKGGEWLTGAR